MNDYLIALSQAQQHDVGVRADLLMEFAYASRDVVEWWEEQGTVSEDALERWHRANVALCAGLVIDP